MAEKATAVPAKPDKKKYAKFIAGLDLLSIALESCGADFIEDNYAEGGGKISYSIDVAFEDVSDSILEAFVTVRARATSRETRRMCTKFDCTYRLSYRVAAQPDKQMLAAFAGNVEINAWPYVRELMRDLTGRMAGPTLTLPLRKG